MHDIKAIRDDRDAWVAALSRRPAYAQEAGKLADDLLARDKELREVLTSLQTAQARRNEASKLIGQAKAKKDDAKAAELMAEVAGLKEQIQDGEKEQRRIEEELKNKLAEIPNLPQSDTPDGGGEDDNVPLEARYWKNEKQTPAEKLNDKAKEHFDLGEALGMMDFERAAKISGARFVYLKNGLARLERALGSFMLDLHTDKFGYTEVNPPVLVRDDAFFGTGQLPKFEEDLFFTDPRTPEWEEETKKFIYKMSRDSVGQGDGPFSRSQLDGYMDLVAKTASQIFMLKNTLDTTRLSPKETGEIVIAPLRRGLIPTAEVSLTNYVSTEILDEAALPYRFTAHTPCFRAEAGAAGRDTRGMIRMHQFSKVELVSITTPEQSQAEHERMTDCAQEVLKRLNLHHRVVALCTGDMGFSAKKTYDIEVWLPGQNRFREISSCSNCGDFQARRMQTRYRGADGKVKGHVHTLNGSGLAVGRTLIAIMENYQEPDGSIRIPDALLPYMGGMTKIEKVGVKHRILVTNDDGIHAPGLAVAEKIAREISDDVWVVAPETEQSGASHSLTLSAPLRLRQISEHRFALSGTPTDCVMMGLSQVMPEKPTLILSGVNRGSNIADDVTYSGTIAGAMEGTALGIPSIALSQSYGFSNAELPRWQCAEAHGADVVKRLLAIGWPEETLININFPDAEPADIAGIEITEQGKRDMQTATMEKRTDLRGHDYYWIGFKRLRSNPHPGTDLRAIYDRKISITPLHLNLTEYKVLEKMRAAFK